MVVKINDNSDSNKIIEIISQPLIRPLLHPKFQLVKFKMVEKSCRKLILLIFKI